MSFEKRRNKHGVISESACMRTVEGTERTWIHWVTELPWLFSLNNNIWISETFEKVRPKNIQLCSQWICVKCSAVRCEMSKFSFNLYVSTVGVSSSDVPEGTPDITIFQVFSDSCERSPFPRIKVHLVFIFMLTWDGINWISPPYPHTHTLISALYLQRRIKLPQTIESIA